MAFDFKKEYRAFYLPKNKPELVLVPSMNYVAVRGAGDPNEPDGAYQQAVGVLYALSYTLKMSEKSGHSIDGFFQYVVPPLEGFWRQEGDGGIDCRNKAGFHWISAIRLPGFITPAHLEWAAGEAARKKKLDCSKAEFLTVEEGLCVQIMHLGPFDDEPASVALMDAYLDEQGYEKDLTPARHHHEIYLSDPRRVPPARFQTVIRHPIRKK